MSSTAIATLQRLWGNLTFDRVQVVIAREPDDVLSITIPYTELTEEGLILRGHTEYNVDSKLTCDIPVRDRWKADIAWRHYFGFTARGIYLQRDSYCGLDCDISLTMTWSMWGNHGSGFDKPNVGDLIAGEIKQTAKGKRFDRWFVCPPELKLLMDSVLHGTQLSENELASRLLTCGYPDSLWAIARLVLFDNVQAFVDQLKDSPPQHPCYGEEYTNIRFFGKKPRVNWNGMFLPCTVAEYVYSLSRHLNEPMWWKEFQRLTAEQGLSYMDPHEVDWDD